MNRHYATSIAVVTAAIPAYLFRFSLFGIPSNIFEVLVLGLVLVGLLLPKVRAHWRAAEQKLPRPVVYCVGLFIAAALLSALISEVPQVSFGIFKSWIIIPILLGWCVYAEARNKKLKTILYPALISSGIIVSILSLTQFRWDERLSGIYDVPNSLALYLAPLIIIAVARAFSPPFEGGVPRRGRGEGVLITVSVFSMFLTLLLTQSVAGVVSVIAVGALLLAIHKKQIVFWVLFGFCLPAIALATAGALSFVFLTSTGRLTYLASPFITGAPNSVSVRLQLWDISWDLIKEHPLLGIGLGQFEPAYQEKLHRRIAEYEAARQPRHGRGQYGGRAVAEPLLEFVYRDPHNWLLSFWLNTGLLGLVSFLGLHSYLFWRVVSLSPNTYHLTPAMLAVLTLLLFGLVDTIYWKNDLAALHWVLLGLILGSGSRLGRDT